MKRRVFIKLLRGRDNEYLHDNWLLKTFMNVDRYVNDNDEIDFAHKGTMSGRPVKNATYPLPFAKRQDIPDSIKLNYYSSPVGLMPKVDLHALQYDKKKSELKDMRDDLMEDIVTEGLWNCSPFEDTNKTPMIQATGPVVNGYKTIVGDDLKRLRIVFNQRMPRYKNKKWHLILDSESYWGLAHGNDILKAQMKMKQVGDVNVSEINYLGFCLHEDDRMPYYGASNRQRLPYGATPVIGSDIRGATAYVDNYTFMAGFGRLELFDQKNNPVYQADMASYLQWAYVGPYSKDARTNLSAMGGIYSTP